MLHRLFKYIFVLVTIAFVYSCGDIDLPVADQQIVVDAWIENGEPPIVILTGTVPNSLETRKYEDLEDYIIKYAKVYISDGEREEQLVTIVNSIDSVIYYTSPSWQIPRFVGEVGKTYDLRIEYSGLTVRASAQIPEPPVLENVRAEAVGEDQYRIHADIVDNPETKDYYKFFIRKNHKWQWESSHLAIYDDVLMDEGRYSVLVPNSLGKSLNKYVSTYNISDTVIVKLCTFSEDIWNYWKDYNDIVAMSRNPIMPVSKPIRFNVQGGIGYFAGYGKAEKRVILTK